MKHLKTTIKLSVLALACMGAGALALQPTAYAKAEDGAGCVTMQNGAAVCVNDDFSGIRWTTKIDFDKYQMLCGAGKTITFGTLVLPTDSLGEDGVLTEADQGAVDIKAKLDVDNLAGDAEYYSIINYDNLADAFTDEATKEESLKKAYALELTARSYVKVNDTYYFADMEGISTSRSAKQVALTAELAGDWTEDDAAKAVKAAAYYGMDERYVPEKVSNGAAGTAYVDLNNGETPAQEVVVNIDFEGTVQSVFIGAERVEYVSYADKKLTFKVAEGQYIPTGENYLTVYTDNGFVTEPVIGATKVLTKAEDLKMFNAKGDNYDRSAKTGTNGVNIPDYWKPEQQQTGYYVLGGNIDANGYTHGSVNAEDAYTKAGEANNSTWNGMANYIGRPIGLSGTFNGLGYTIDGITIGTQREGIFGIVNGGTVKNVAIENVKNTITYTYVIANYLYNATIDNVYIATNEYKAEDANNPGYAYTAGSGIVAASAYGTTKISNTYLRLNKYSGTTGECTFGALFGSTHSTESFTCENVIVLVRNHFTYSAGTTTETDGVETTTYKKTTAQYYVAMVTKATPKIVKDADGKYTVVQTKGSLYLAENQTLTALANGVTFAAEAYDVKTLNGVYYYGQKDTWAEHDFAGFLASGCWKMSEGKPVWIS